MRFFDRLKTVPPMALILGLAGLLPFILGGLGVWLTILGDLRFALPLISVAYAALIASFLGGVRWGAAMQNADTGKLPRYLVMAITPSLIALVGFMLPLPQAFILFITLFVAQAVVDLTAVESGDLIDWYAPLRLLLAAIACLAMLSLFIHTLTH